MSVSFSQWCNGFKGKDSQRVTIESTFCPVVEFGFPKARSYFFRFLHYTAITSSESSTLHSVRFLSLSEISNVPAYYH